MGLFSFLFSKHKTFRTTLEAEACRAIFRENEGLFQRVEGSEELKRYKELEVLVNDPAFKKKKKEIEALTYQHSECYKAEKQYKVLLKQRPLKSYLSIHESEELREYERVKQSAEYQEYIQLEAIVKAVGFDKKSQSAEYKAYQKIIRHPKIAALIKFENLRRYKEYKEVKNTELPQQLAQLTTYLQSEEFKNNRKFLLDKHRYSTTRDYELQQEYESLKKRPDIVQYNALQQDPYFCRMRQWKLVFEDDFDQGHLDATKWITRYYAGERFLNDTYGVGKDVQLYTPDNITFKASAVCLNFRKELLVGKYWDDKVGIRERKYDYTSAMISSALSFRQRYGRFEAKVRLNRVAVTSCFWMLGETQMPHIEIMKCQDDGVRVGRMYSSQTAVVDDIQEVKNVALAKEYYIFTLEWTEEKLVWMVNDMVIKEEHENIPDVPMYIVFSLGANEAPGDKCIPASLEIDWVRAYQRKTDN